MTGLNRKHGPPRTSGIPAYGVIVFVALAGFWGVHGLTRGVEHLSGDQHITLLLVLKGEDPSLFSKDFIFGGQDLTEEYIPLYIGFLRLASRFTGDLAAGYKLMVVPLTLLYLCGAYFVFLRFSRKPWVAVILAIFSSLPLAVPLGDEIFGLGQVGTMVARTIFTAAFPFLFLALCSWIESPRRLVLLFLGIGLLANFHPVSVLHAVPILIITYLLEARGARRSWVVAGAMGLAMLVGAAPIVWDHLQHLGKQAAMSVGYGEFLAQVAMVRFEKLMYPPRGMKGVPRMIVDGLTVGVTVASVVLVVHRWASKHQRGGLCLRLVAVIALGYLLYPMGQLLCALLAILFLLPQSEYGLREERLGVYFALAILWVSIVELIVFQFVLPIRDHPIFFLTYHRGVRFAVFAVFLLLAVSVRLADWSRVTGVVRIALIVLVVFTGFWQARHTVRTYLRTHRDLEAAHRLAMARWAREETDPRDLFLFDSADFRVMGRRSLAFATKDGDAVISHRPDRAAAWLERFASLRAAGSNPVALLEAGVRYGAQYVVVPAHAVRGTGLESRIRYQNPTYTVLTTDQARLSGSPVTRGGQS